MVKRRTIVESGVERRGRTVGYLRVSTDGQDLEKNKADILNLANEKNLGRVEWVEEKASGKISWKDRKIKPLLDGMQKGDNLIVAELSRLGRSMLDILEIVKIARDREINVYAAKNHWRLDGGIESKIVGMVLAMASEIERDLISSRTKEALRTKKALGARLGRPKGPGKSKLDQFRPEIEALLRNGSTQAFVSRRYGTTAANLNNWLKKNKIDKRPVTNP
jgi:DNA invertase Pin-like site-specific DNA recombinase